MIGVRARRFTERVRSLSGVELGVRGEAKAPMMRFSKTLKKRFIGATTVAVLFLRNAPIVK